MKKIAVFVFCICLSSPIFGQISRLKEIREMRHNACVKEIEGNYAEAADSFAQIIASTSDLPELIGEWNDGTAFYFLARCNARLGKVADVRFDLSSALKHQFRNVGLVYADSQLLYTCGVQWFDSLEKAWGPIHVAEMTHWEKQSPIVVVPRTFRSSQKLPLIVAFHGGNASYISFSERWHEVADSLGVIVVIPPGNVRISNTTNSWDNDLTAEAKTVHSVIEMAVHTYSADPAQIYFAGFSQGARLALLLSVMDTISVQGAIALSGFTDTLPSDKQLQLASKRGLKVYAVSGTYDSQENLTSMKKAQGVFTSHNISFKYDLVNRMPHEIPLDFCPRICNAWQWFHQNN